jgi:hypothetical protein
LYSRINKKNQGQYSRVLINIFFHSLSEYFMTDNIRHTCTAAASFPERRELLLVQRNPFLEALVLLDERVDRAAQCLVAVV